MVPNRFGDPHNLTLKQCGQFLFVNVTVFFFRTQFAEFAQKNFNLGLSHCQTNSQNGDQEKISYRKTPKHSHSSDSLGTVSQDT